MNCDIIFALGLSLVSYGILGLSAIICLSFRSLLSLSGLTVSLALFSRAVCRVVSVSSMCPCLIGWRGDLADARSLMGRLIV